MLLSKETTVRVTDVQSNIIRHMGYAAYKLWNICNYERKAYNASSGDPYPDWYYQKSAHKSDVWYKSLPSQTAQEVCKLLDKSWKSYFKLLKTDGVANPNPPRFKHDPIAVTYMQNGIRRMSKTCLRLSLPKALKAHMAERYNIHENYLFIENSFFDGMDVIKQIKLYMPENGVMRVIVVYEIPGIRMFPDNGHYLSIDLGVHNLMTCFDSDGGSFIVGREYLTITRKYDKVIAKVQGQWASQQTAKGIKYPKPSKHTLSLYEKKCHCVKDYLHKITHYIAMYCKKHHINTVVTGDITGIREGRDLGDRINRELHALPYKKITMMLEYKLQLLGITLVTVNEAYSSQCSPLSPKVSKQYAVKSNRVLRGLYSDGSSIWNADAVGAYNILRIYLRRVKSKQIVLPVGLSNPAVIKVAA